MDRTGEFVVLRAALAALTAEVAAKLDPDDSAALDDLAAAAEAIRRAPDLAALAAVPWVRAMADMELHP